LISRDRFDFALSLFLGGLGVLAVPSSPHSPVVPRRLRLAALAFVPPRLAKPVPCHVKEIFHKAVKSPSLSDTMQSEYVTCRLNGSLALSRRIGRDELFPGALPQAVMSCPFGAKGTTTLRGARSTRNVARRRAKRNLRGEGSSANAARPRGELTQYDNPKRYTPGAVQPETLPGDRLKSYPM